MCKRLICCLSTALLISAVLCAVAMAQPRPKPAPKPSKAAPKPAKPAEDNTPAIPTKVVVRAISRDAKVIGSKVGGARITIREAATGTVLAKGVQEGETGDTAAIMINPRKRGDLVFSLKNAAGFEATLMLRQPTVVEIIAEGPLGSAQATQRASKTMLLVPGQHVVGEGVLMEIHGLIVTMLTPELKAAVIEGQEVEVKVTVTMSCGCPTEPGGLWDASRMTVVARIIQGGKVVFESPLAFAGETSTFKSVVKFPAKGPARLDVIAMDPASANFGWVKRVVTVAATPPPPPPIPPPTETAPPPTP